MKTNKTRSSPKMEHFFSPNSGEDQKKRSSPEMEHLYSPNSKTDLCSDAHQSQIIVGDADEDHTQIVGGIQSNYWGDISPLGFGITAVSFFALPFRLLKRMLINFYFMVLLSDVIIMFCLVQPPEAIQPLVNFCDFLKKYPF